MKSHSKKTNANNKIKITRKFRHEKHKQPGQSPGTVIHTGSRKIEKALITLHDYDKDNYNATSIDNFDKAKITDSQFKWIQVCGLHDIEKLKTIWNHFDLHPLIQEDIVNTSQRAKVESYGDSIFVVLRMITAKTAEPSDDDFKTEQISIVLGKDFVLSFQESDYPIFNPVVKRMELKNTNIHKFGVDYLAYALIDCVIDHYFESLDVIGETIELIEEKILDAPQSIHLKNIHVLRSNLIYFRKSVWSLRDGINSLIRDESPLISKDVKVFLRDVSDHVARVIDTTENYREMVLSVYDMYMSTLSNKMNEIMKVLTIIATIFIPLTFIAGVYGMNFNPDKSPFNMPELNWVWGYPFSLLLMGGVTIAMWLFFKRKGWL